MQQAQGVLALSTKSIITDYYHLTIQLMSQNHATFIQSHIVRRFNILKKVGSGAYGHVWKVEQKSTKRIFALKKIFDAFQHATDAQRTYRQIQILKQLEHPNIIKLYETIRADNNKDVYLLFQYMQADLHNVISQGILKDVHIRFIIYQLAKSLKYLHSAAIIHRDLKPSNILVNSNCAIKLCDFGLVRSLLPTTENVAVLTQGVATRWYRAPEVLLGSKSYSTPADIWSFGCIVYQVLAQKPLFPGNSTLDQIEKICLFTGHPTEQDICSLQSEVARSMMKEIKISMNSKSNNFLKDFSPLFVDLLEKIIVFNPIKRLKIQDILNHEVVKAFHKPEEETMCTKVVSTSIDDNKKLTVDQYRKLVYGINGVKSKALSASLGTNSAKYLPNNNKTSILASNTPTSKGQMIEKPELQKKYSHEKIRATTTITASYTKIGQDYNDSKKFEKPVLKYVRSNKDVTKNIENIVQNPYKKFPDQPQSKIEPQQNNQEAPEIPSKIQQIKKQTHSAYITSNSSKLYADKHRPAVQSSNSSGYGSVSTQNMGTWKALKTGLTVNTVISPKQIKQKAAIFKSPKYISINKSELVKSTPAYHPYEGSQKPG